VKKLKNLTPLQKFYLYHLELTSKGLESIVKSLYTNKNLIKLAIIENKIGDQGVEIVAKYLKQSKMTDLILRDCDVKASGFKELGKAIKETTSLLKLDVSENPMDIDAIKGLSEGLNGNTHLTHLELSFNGIDGAESKILTSALINNKAIKKVEISENSIGNDGAKEFALLFEKDTPLERVDLSNNKIGVEGSKVILEALLKK